MTARAKIRALALVPLALSLMACPPSEQSIQTWSDMRQDRQAQLAEAGEDWRAAYAAGEWEALRALYADDAVLMTQGQDKIVGADNIVAFLQRLPQAGAKVDFHFANEEVLVEGTGAGELGIVTAKYRMDIAFPERGPVIVAGRSLLVYKWEDGAWKLWRDIDNLAPDVTAESFNR